MRARAISATVWGKSFVLSRCFPRLRRHCIDGNQPGPRSLDSEIQPCHAVNGIQSRNQQIAVLAVDAQAAEPRQQTAADEADALRHPGQGDCRGFIGSAFNDQRHSNAENGSDTQPEDTCKQRPPVKRTEQKPPAGNDGQRNGPEHQLRLAA